MGKLQYRNLWSSLPTIEALTIGQCYNESAKIIRVLKGFSDSRINVTVILKCNIVNYS